MFDSLIAWSLRMLKDYGVYGTIFIILGIIFPWVTIATAIGYGFWWGVAHSIIFIPFLIAVIIGTAHTPRKIRPTLWITGGLASLIFALGIFDHTKPVAILIGLILSEIGLGFLALVGSGVALGYGLALSPATGETETISGANKRGANTFKQFLGIAAWECFAAWYLTSLGQYLSVYATTFVLCAGGVILYGTIAWDIGGKFGKKVVYYGALTGFIGVTAHAIYKLLFATACEIVSGSNGQKTQVCTGTAWITDVPELFLKAAHIDDHILGWLIAIITILAITSTLSRLTGKKWVTETVERITWATGLILFLVWIFEFDGVSKITLLVHTLGTFTYPEIQTWRGIMWLATFVLGSLYAYKGYCDWGRAGIVSTAIKTLFLFILPSVLLDHLFWGGGMKALEPFIKSFIVKLLA